MDLGGAHSNYMTTINFATGEITCGNAPGQNSNMYGNIYGTTLTAPYSIRDVFKALGAEDTETWKGETFADGTYHTLDFFYFKVRLPQFSVADVKSYLLVHLAVFNRKLCHI